MQSQPYTLIDEGSSFTVRILPTRSLGIAQILCGSLMMLLGLLVFLEPYYYVGHVLLAMTCGIWVVVGGILGLCSAAFTSSTSLNWGNMSFAIVSTCATISEVVIYFLAVLKVQSCDLSYSYSHTIKYNITNIYRGRPQSLESAFHEGPHNCSNYSISTGTALFVSLVVLSITQFGIAVAVILYCWKYGRSSCYCGEAREMVTQQPGTAPSSVEMQTCTQASGQTGYPAASYPVATHPVPFSYPVATYPHAFESSAQPVFAGHQQGAHTGTGVAATVQPVVVGYIPIVPQSSQFAQLPMQ